MIGAKSEGRQASVALRAFDGCFCPSVCAPRFRRRRRCCCCCYSRATVSNRQLSDFKWGPPVRKLQPPTRRRNRAIARTMDGNRLQFTARTPPSERANGLRVRRCQCGHSRSAQGCQQSREIAPACVARTRRCARSCTGGGGAKEAFARA